MKKWNFLWISFEDTSPVHGCYGFKEAQTPNVDAFAREAVIYPNAFACTGVCAPSRAAVITSMYPTSIGAHHMRTSWTDENLPELPTPYGACPPPYVKCFTEYLRADGYYCSNNKKTDYQFPAPVTAWDDCSKNGHWRNRPDKDQPFFAVFNPCMTHESGAWPENCPEVEIAPEDVTVPPIYPDTPKVRTAIARMYTQLKKADKIFGNLIAQLKEDGLYENTIIMHWSDHGPLPRGKRWVYDTGIKIPMIIRIPGELDDGSQNDRLVSTVDLGPTLLSLAGITIPKHIEGQAFLGDQALPEREYTYHSRDRYDTSYDQVRAIRSKKFKYIRNYYPDLPRLIWVPYRNRHPILQEMMRLEAAGDLKQEFRQLFESPRPVEELYDLDNDPWETNNLAYEKGYIQDKEKLVSALKEWQKDSDPYERIDESEMVKNWKTEDGMPSTVKPLFMAFGGEEYALKPLEEGQELPGPIHLQLTTATQGASINVKVIKTSDEATEESSSWQLYSQFIQLEEGDYLLQGQAQRIGFDESEISSVRISVV